MLCSLPNLQEQAGQGIHFVEAGKYQRCGFVAWARFVGRLQHPLFQMAQDCLTQKQHQPSCVTIVSLAAEGAHWIGLHWVLLLTTAMLATVCVLLVTCWCIAGKACEPQGPNHS